MSGHQRKGLTLVCVLLGFMVSGCSTQARWVNCEARLEPINRPAPKAKDAPRAVQPSNETKKGGTP